MEQFSDTLTQEMIDYAWEHYRTRITPDQAQEYLRSLAAIFLTLQKIETRRRGKKTKRP
ncbi:MAG TPA: hypothetical protein VMT81_02145 [Candidatus Paceibacterota bacterium]|nr:hypothetical protein [Candidatus Paceibacterota bacterium]